MIQLLMAELSVAGKLEDKLIEDKDKRAEYAFKVQEMVFRTMEIKKKHRIEDEEW